MRATRMPSRLRARRVPGGRLAAFALVALLSPCAAHACAVCGAAVERNRMAFLGTTVLLSLLPLAMMAGGLWWIARHSRGRVADEFEEREPAVAPGAAAPLPPAGALATSSPGGAESRLTPGGAGGR